MFLATRMTGDGSVWGSLMRVENCTSKTKATEKWGLVIELSGGG